MANKMLGSLAVNVPFLIAEINMVYFQAWAKKTSAVPRLIFLDKFDKANDDKQY